MMLRNNPRMSDVHRLPLKDWILPAFNNAASHSCISAPIGKSTRESFSTEAWQWQARNKHLNKIDADPSNDRPELQFACENQAALFRMAAIYLPTTISHATSYAAIT
jgi:hypothetical protein